MSHRIPNEIRLKALAYFREGYRSRKITRLLKSVCRTTIINWQNRYDHGDLTWISCGRRRKASPERAQEAVRLYRELGSYSAAGRQLGIAPTDVRHFVNNVEKFGEPFRGNPHMRKEKNLEESWKNRIKTVDLTDNQSVAENQPPEHANSGSVPVGAAGSDATASFADSVVGSITPGISHPIDAIEKENAELRAVLDCVIQEIKSRNGKVPDLEAIKKIHIGSRG